MYWRKPAGDVDANECICLGDGKHVPNHAKTSSKNSVTHSLVQQYNKEPGSNKERTGAGGSSSVSLRVHDSYSPNKCLPMPGHGPPGHPPTTYFNIQSTTK